MAEGLEVLAAVIAERDRLGLAVQFWGAAAALRAAMGCQGSLSARVAVEEQVDAVRDRMGVEQFGRAWAEGSEMGWEQAILRALGGWEGGDDLPTL